MSGLVALTTIGNSATDGTTTAEPHAARGQGTPVPVIGTSQSGQHDQPPTGTDPWCTKIAGTT